MAITLVQIEELASRPGVVRIAVENFLTTLEGMSSREAYHNMRLDARSYKWNRETVKALEQGLEIHYR
jgi:hypothetical protein